MSALHPRTDGSTCVRCRKLFKPGDRAMPCMIVLSVGRNPQTRELGANISSEFEMTHIDCHDPQLTAAILIT